MPSTPSRHLPSADKLSVLTAIMVLAYALTRALDLPTRLYETTLLGSQLGLELDGPLLMMVLAAALISTGADTLIRSHPRLAGRAAERTVLHWIVPGAAALVLGGVLNQVPDGPLWWIGLALAALALLLILVAEFIVVDPEDPAWQLAALGLTALTYALALLLFALLRAESVRALVGSTLGGMTAAALALRLFALKAAPLPRATLYALLVGLITAQALWALSYWRISSASAGLLAMIPFYLSTGLAQQHLAGRLTRRVWLEYGVVGGVGLAIALIYAIA